MASIGSLLHVRTTNWGWRKSLTFQRLGFELTFWWREAQVWHRPTWTHGVGSLTLGYLGIVLQIKKSDLGKRAVACRKCGRLWPAVLQSPIPGDGPAWAKYSVDERMQFSGEWERDMVFKDGEYVYTPYRWLGPCCENNYSGQFEDEEDPDEYQETEIMDTFFARYLFMTPDGHYRIEEISSYRLSGQDWGMTPDDQWQHEQFPLLNTRRPFLCHLVKCLRSGALPELKPGGEHVDICYLPDYDDEDEEIA